MTIDTRFPIGWPGVWQEPVPLWVEPEFAPRPLQHGPEHINATPWHVDGVHFVPVPPTTWPVFVRPRPFVSKFRMRRHG